MSQQNITITFLVKGKMTKPLEIADESATIRDMMIENQINTSLQAFTPSGDEVDISDPAHLYSMLSFSDDSSSNG